MNGANFGGNYQPDLTSYDYDAPLDEAGRATPKYDAIRQVLRAHLPPGETLPEVPQPNPVIRVPRFELNDAGSLLGTLPAAVKSENVRPMEELGQAYGFILYRTTVQGPLTGTLTLHELRDYAVVLVNGKRAGLLDRRRGGKGLSLNLPAGSVTLDLLVENGGRINYGPLLTENKKGITGSVRLGETELKGWEIYPLPLERVDRLRFDGRETDGPTFRRGTFSVENVGDTFLDLRGWTKGVVWINGHNLGRFWQIGPQQTLYVPGPWLRRGANQLVVLDLAPSGQKSVEGLDEPVLSELRPEAPRHASRPAPNPRPALAAAERVATGEFGSGEAAQDVRFPARSGRYLALQAIDSYDGDYASAAELYLLDANGKPLPRDAWKIYYASSEESAQEDGNAENLIDDDPDTIWHTVWSQAHPSLPHFVVIDLGHEMTSSGLRYLARRGEKPAKIRHFAAYLSSRPFNPMP
jgi:beta-galactosidase